MKIVTTPKKIVEFRKVNYGQVFCYEEVYYLKIHDKESNALSLVTYRTYMFNNMSLVTVYDSTLTIEE